jgi:DNA-binding MltR family transcriptional regulator
MAINPESGQRLGRDVLMTRLKALGKVRMGEIKVDDHIARLKAESDRGVMILAATMVEDALLEALQKVTKFADNSDMRAKIYHGDGPLASFSKRITFAQALGLISKEVARQMHVVREVRNTAAHAHVTMDFSVQDVKNALGTLLGEKEADDLETWPAEKVRFFYLGLCGYMADTIEGPIATRKEPIKALYIAMKAGIPAKPA